MEARFFQQVRIGCRVTMVVLFIVFFVPSMLSAGQEKRLYHDLFSVSFPTENDGWVCGRWGTILHTSDGGKSWEPQESGTDFTLSCICFANAKEGWAVGDGGVIVHTGDGGKTWKQQKSPEIMVDAGFRWGGEGFMTEAEKTTVTLFYMGVDFANARKGWIVGERTHILYTEDGGKTWQVQFSDEDFILKDVSFCDENNGWAVGEYGYIYHTNDGGETWEHQAGEFDFSEETGEVVGGNFLFDVIAVDPQTAWAAGIDGCVMRTMDGGMSWEQMTKGIPKSHLFGITVEGKGTVLIGGTAQLLYSSDGGASFEVATAEPPITYGWIYRIVPKGGGSFAGVGRAGWVYISDNEGVSWRKVEGR